MGRLFWLTSRFRSLPLWTRIGATTLVVLACLGVRLLVFGLQPGFPFLLFYPAVIMVAVAFGQGSGTYASFLSAVLALYYLIEPAGSFALTEEGGLALTMYLALTLLTTMLVEALYVALCSLVTEKQNLLEANSELKRLADNRATLLSDAIHRARNDLQRLAATLHVQASASSTSDARQAFLEASERIATLARINARLDLHRPDGDAEVDSKGFIDGLVEDLQNGLVGLRPIALLSSSEGHVIPLARAVPLGLIINELVVNVLKYAFPGDMEGRVQIRFERAADEEMLLVEDDGIGFDPAAPPQGTGVGTRIVRSLAAQLGGRADMAPASTGAQRPGVRWIMRFPVPSAT
jgi:two-component sensor histidine kinase